MMIGEPLPDPREAIILDLERSKGEYLASGKSIQSIPYGQSSYISERHVTGYQKIQRAERAKLAPALMEFSEAGRSLRTAASTLKLRMDRALLICKENNIVFSND